MTLTKGRGPARVLAVCALLGAAGAGLAQTTLSVAQMRAAAGESLRVGAPAQAEVLAGALLERDGGDLNALLIRARALRDLGRLKEARGMARRAWALSRTDADRYATALITAQVLSTQGKRTRAQFWLRRAVQHAPSPQLEAIARRDFRYLRARNPWHTQLSFTLAPNSNINNGSARDRSYLNYRLSEVLFEEPVEFQLQGAARALSGFEYGAGVQTRYRFAQSATHAHDLSFAASYRTFTLSSRAKANAPGVSGSDFAFGQVSLGYGFEQRNLGQRGRFTFGADAGQSFYGGARYASYLRLSLAQGLLTGKRSQTRLSLDHEWQNGQATSDTTRFGGMLDWSHRRDNGALVTLSLGAERTTSPNSDLEYNALRLRGGAALARPVLGADLRVDLGAEIRDYDVSRHAPGGRRDKRYFMDVTATFRGIDYYGFSPSVTLQASTTDSNIGLYDVNRVGLSLGVRSAF